MNLYHLIFLCSILLFSACKEQKQSPEEKIEPPTNTSKQSEPITEEKKEIEEPILLGIQTKDSLQKTPYRNWFYEAYKNYQPNETVIKELQPLLRDIRIKAFMGTWCEDSQREIPTFYKILETAGYHPKDLTLITVSRDKDTPDGLEKGLDIEYVPTLLFYKDQKELGRIVESPIETLEKDMLTILSGKPYKHTYAN